MLDLALISLEHYIWYQNLIKLGEAARVLRELILYDTTSFITGTAQCIGKPITLILIEASNWIIRRVDNG